MRKLLDQNIDSVEFVQENGNLKYIKGKYVATLCDVCDSWEVSTPEDIFLSLCGKCFSAFHRFS